MKFKIKEINKSRIYYLAFFFIIVIFLWNFVLLLQLRTAKDKQKKLRLNNQELINLKDYYRNYLKDQFYFQSSILKNDIINNLPDSISLCDGIFIILIPKDACNACITELFNILNTRQDKFKFFLINEEKSNFAFKEWLYYKFEEYNYSIDISGIFKKTQFDQNIVVSKFLSYDNCIFFQYDIGIKDLLEFFLNSPIR